jgi:phage/plasmid-associated DNA primase
MDARGMYDKGGEFLIQFKTLVACNDLPQLTNVENNNSIYRRLDIFRFSNTFIDEGDTQYNLNDENIKIKDNDLDNNFKTNKIKNAFIIYLLNVYIKYSNNKPIIPKLILDERKKYLDGCNQLVNFIEEYYDIDENERVLVSRFKEHFKEIYGKFNPLVKDSNKFDDTLNHLGYKKIKNSNYFYCGLKRRLNNINNNFIEDE